VHGCQRESHLLQSVFFIFSLNVSGSFTRNVGILSMNGLFTAFKAVYIIYLDTKKKAFRLFVSGYASHGTYLAQRL